MDGDLLNAIARVSGEQVVAPPTALVADYPNAADSIVEMNNDHLEKGKSARLANKEGFSVEGGVLLLTIALSGTASVDVVAEINEHFNDGVLSFAASKQREEQATLIKGGWLRPYKNTLSTNEADQTKSVVAVSSQRFAQFKATMPHVQGG